MPITPARTIAQFTGFGGRISYDAARADCAPRKLLDVSRLTNVGCTACTPLGEGIRQTYDWGLANWDRLREA